MAGLTEVLAGGVPELPPTALLTGAPVPGPAPPTSLGPEPAEQAARLNPARPRARNLAASIAPPCDRGIDTGRLGQNSVAGVGALLNLVNNFLHLGGGESSHDLRANVAAFDGV